MNRKEELLELFRVPHDEEKLNALIAKKAPTKKYIVAMTPRSGSSYLCDVMIKAKALGRPGEMLSRQFLPNLLKNAPGNTPDEYLSHILKFTQSANGVSGIKASWFQFADFSAAMTDAGALKDFKYIYLTRRDLALQAVSLYRATETDVFHTNIEHSDAKLAKLQKLGFDFKKVDYWQKHIAVQEADWIKYFVNHNIYPLCITYEDIETDVVAVVRRIANYLEVPAAAKLSSAESIFKKIGERKNLKWACRYLLEKDELQRASAETEAKKE